MTENLIGPDDPDIPEEVPPTRVPLDNAALAKRMLIWGVAILVLGVAYTLFFQFVPPRWYSNAMEIMSFVSIVGGVLQLCLMPLAGCLIVGAIIVRRMPERTVAPRTT